MDVLAFSISLPQNRYLRKFLYKKTLQDQRLSKGSEAIDVLGFFIFSILICICSKKNITIKTMKIGHWPRVQVR